MICPLCGSRVERLASNGFCNPCPVYSKYLDLAKTTEPSGSRRKKLSQGPIIQKPSGRSGKITRYIH